LVFFFYVNVTKLCSFEKSSIYKRKYVLPRKQHSLCDSNGTEGSAVKLSEVSRYLSVDFMGHSDLQLIDFVCS